MSEISVEFGGWFDVTLEMEKVYHTGEYNIYTLFYEDLKLVSDLYTVKFTSTALHQIWWELNSPRGGGGYLSIYNMVQTCFCLGWLYIDR